MLGHAGQVCVCMYNHSFPQAALTSLKAKQSKNGLLSVADVYLTYISQSHTHHLWK